MDRGMGWTRRGFLKTAALALPALALPGAASGAAAQQPAPRPAGAARKVIVVGAGLAGLAAAHELVAAGHDVTVLEARMRPGGRVHTLRSPFADGLYAEAGAIGFADTRTLRRYLDLFHIPTEPFRSSSLAKVFHLRGRRLAVKPGEEPAWPFELTAEERKLGFGGLLEKHFFAAGAKLGDPTDPAFRLAPFARYDRVTLAELLRSQGASSEAIALLSANLAWGYGWAAGSALHRLISDVALYFAGHQRGLVIPGGSDLLPRAFAKALRERIFYGSPVEKIVQEPAGVRAVCRQAGVERTLAADRLICTVPCPVLRRIELVPALPAAKRRIVEGLAYTPVTRIYLQSRRRFWEEAGEAGGAFTDLPIQLVSEHPFAQSAVQGPRGILEAHLKGPEAKRIGAMEQTAQLAFAAGQMEAVHPGFQRFVEGGTAVDWAADPWAGGAYAEWKPGELTDWLPELVRPEGRVHFAGEHTSVMGRTVEGALESGNRAAREVMEAAS